MNFRRMHFIYRGILIPIILFVTFNYSYCQTLKEKRHNLLIGNWVMSDGITRMHITKDTIKLFTIGYPNSTSYFYNLDGACNNDTIKWAYVPAFYISERWTGEKNNTSRFGCIPVQSVDSNYLKMNWDYNSDYLGKALVFKRKN